jgi:hypothetical protein
MANLIAIMLIVSFFFLGKLFANREKGMTRNVIRDTRSLMRCLLKGTYVLSSVPREGLFHTKYPLMAVRC